MAWENRKGHGRYYTRSIKRVGRVMRQYFGIGPLAELAAKEDADRRAERAAEHEAWRDEREQIEAVEDQVRVVHRSADLLMKAVLYAQGYHQHKRGEWRCRRVANSSGRQVRR